MVLIGHATPIQHKHEHHSTYNLTAPWFHPLSFGKCGWRLSTSTLQPIHQSPADQCSTSNIPQAWPPLSHDAGNWVALMPEFINFCIESSKSTSGRQLFGHLCPSWAAFGLTGFTHSLGPPSITLTTRFHISHLGPPFSLYPVQHRTQQTWFYHAMFPR